MGGRGLVRAWGPSEELGRGAGGGAHSAAWIFGLCYCFRYCFVL